MSISSFDTGNAMIQLTMILKTEKLKSEQLSSLSYDNLEDYLNQRLWKNGAPSSLHEAADQILHVNANDIVRFLSDQAIKEGAHADLKDFSDIVGGN